MPKKDKKKYGIAASCGELNPLVGLISEADKALYKAKEEGRNRVISTQET